MDRKTIARDYHAKGFNCAQSVFSAFEDLTGMPCETSLTVAAGFGGGLRQGEICGAASGAVMAIGVMFPFNDASDAPAKQKIAELSVEYLGLFRAKCGHLTCRDLLGCDTSTPEGAKHNTEFGISRKLCPGIIDNAVEALEEIVAKHK